MLSYFFKCGKNTESKNTKVAKTKNFNTRYTMNEIVNKFLLVGDKFMLEMHLRQPGFTYCAGASNLVKKLTITQKLVKLKIKSLLIMIMINILLLKNLIG